MPDYEHPAPADLTLLAVLRGLADPARLEIVRHLGSIEEASCATLLGERPRSSMSHHFQVLRESGLIYTRVQGVQHFNSLRRAELNARFPGLLDAILAD
ncbi:ArsR/SmtB family transcription factor [Kozakia baliensis]|uniref:Transcriptional regulator n=1 Tax=Kozakia baliensis TaxID=153496 RepID=A0A1D8UV16_9PROT|nr:helix-turn-helix domain-containing protein [Kozakia baliensis]AOX17480.1 transcriptional regulator [Kozakia baliensis]GBR30669.1 ArsR family transcriptional regulator [Kozakia baliensis NRIC 0488]GEL63057.1 transcriptional regulator [Kozakia baliensis]